MIFFQCVLLFAVDGKGKPECKLQYPLLTVECAIAMWCLHIQRSC